MPIKAPTLRKATRPRERDVRPSAAARGYDRDWREFRRWYAGQVAPVCVRCNRAEESALMHLDHIKPLSQGGERLDPDNAQWLCRECHSRKTMTEDAKSI